MTTKEYLQQAYWLDRRIQLDVEKIECMKSALYGRATSYETDGSQHLASGNGIERAIHKVIDYENCINSEIDSLVDKRIEIERVIGTLENDREREILTRRYLKYEKWEHIAVDMNTDIRWIYRIHNRALSKIDH